MVHSDNEVSVLRNGGSGAPGITLGSNGGAGGGSDSGQIGQTQRIQNYFLRFQEERVAWEDLGRAAKTRGRGGSGWGEIIRYLSA